MVNIIILIFRPGNAETGRLGINIDVNNYFNDARFSRKFDFIEDFESRSNKIAKFIYDF
jgi:hypothetical protein